MTPSSEPLSAGFSRRHFLALSAGAMAATTFAGRSVASSAGPIRVGLIGGDSDGISLLARALRADSGFRLVAIADELDTRAQRALDIFTHQRRRGGAHPQVAVDPARLYAGDDAAARLCADRNVDAVFVAGIPAYRPRQVAAAIAGGKHVFMLGPGAVDAEGCRALLQAANAAEVAGLTIGVDLAERGRPLAGPTTIDARWQRTPWRRSVPGGPAVQNWYFDEALSGGVLLTENFGTIDRVNQLMGTPPAFASGIAGRDGEFGDHAIEYRYPNGGVFRLRSRLGKGLATEFDARFADGSPLPGEGADDASPVGTFLNGIRRGQMGSWRPTLDRLVATTQTAILGREASRLGRSMQWAEIG